MNRLNRRGEEDMARGQEIEEHYEDPIAAWQIEHDTNRKDMTPSQDTRYRQFIKVADRGLDLKRLTYGQLLVRTGRVTP